jgi:ADP-ribose pyrophosphatase YjhB (NUDIX family)
MKPFKRTLAVAIHGVGGGAASTVLAVRRPPDDDDLPGIWGLPAVSLSEEEEWEEAVRRLGAAKLGVVLEPLRKRGEGEQERADYSLHMQLWEARIVEGEPTVPQPGPGVTQYVEWKWAPGELLADGARAGSLCCRLYLGHPRRLTS